MIADESSGKTLGYFVPPKPDEIYTTTYEPDTIVNLDEFPEHKDVDFFWIYPLELEPEWKNLRFTVEEALDWVLENEWDEILALTDKLMAEGNTPRIPRESAPGLVDKITAKLLEEEGEEI